MLEARESQRAPKKQCHEPGYVKISVEVARLLLPIAKTEMVRSDAMVKATFNMKNQIPVLIEDENVFSVKACEASASYYRARAVYEYLKKSIIEAEKRHE